MLDKLFTGGASDLVKSVGGVIDGLHTSDEERLAAELKKDNLMMLQFGIAKELGKSLVEIKNMTIEEIIGWSSYFQIINEEQEKEFEKAKRRR